VSTHPHGKPHVAGPGQGAQLMMYLPVECETHSDYISNQVYGLSSTVAKWDWGKTTKGWLIYTFHVQ